MGLKKQKGFSLIELLIVGWRSF
ncbi:MAG TPA: type II secretion system protein [Terriglobales bacterium]|nr:type II secretion system protein [Terriglobales bacterium]